MILPRRSIPIILAIIVVVFLMNTHALKKPAKLQHAQIPSPAAL